MQSPVYGSQSPAHWQGLQPYSSKPQYPSMHWSQCGPATPGLQTQSPLSGLQFVEPTWLHMQAVPKERKLAHIRLQMTCILLVVFPEALLKYTCALL